MFEGGAYADQAMHAESKGLDPRDRGLAMHLAYGAVQRRGTLDHLIAGLCDRPVAALDASVIAALRLGMYELLYLRGAPDYAIVADAVELAKGGGRGHGLVNAVLRRAGREGAPALLATLGEETPERAAVMHSHPEWVARLWWDLLGPDRARELMAADNEPGEVALRANTLVGGAAELSRLLPVACITDERLPEALIVQEAFDAHASELYRSGALISQSRAAMHVARALDPQPGERVLDLCAAPGERAPTWRHLWAGRERCSRSSATRGAPPPSHARRSDCTLRTYASWWRTPRSRERSRRSIECSWTRPARGSARCRRAPTCAGG